MFRSRKSKILSAAGFAAAIGAAVLTGPPAHAAITGQNIVWAGLNGDSGCELHAHAHNYPLQLYPCNDIGTGDTTSWWQLINPQSEPFPFYGNRTAVELQLAGTDECANDVDTTVYLDSCVKGDTNELFWARATPTAHNWWFINAAESQVYGENLYMTVASFTSGTFVDDLPEGNGERAEWYVFGS